MARKAVAVTVEEADRQTLEGWVRASTTEQRLAQRARIVLAAAHGASNQAIAATVGVSIQTVGKWRYRYLKEGVAGLQDAPRPGRPKRYEEETEQRVLRQLDQPPPEGHATWTGRLLAKALGEVSAQQVWRVLRKHRISLRQRRSWCVSTDPSFVRKAADIVGLYLQPPENAVVLCVDEKPHIQALERAQGYLKLPNGRALTGFSHEYERHGTTTLLGALEVATGLVKTGHYPRRRRREFLDFMKGVLADYPDRDIHVIVDNLNIHKPKQEDWLTRHPRVTFHYTPTHASWLNEIEIWFSILSRRALRGASFRSVGELREAIDRFVVAYNEDAAPFEWRKAEVHPGGLARSYADLRK